MTTYQSSAVTAGIMPDYTRAGIVLCRSAVFTVEAELISGDTIEMVPIPNGAQILNIVVENNSLNQWAGLATFSVGDGNDVDVHMTWPFTGIIMRNDFYSANTLQRAPKTTDIVFEYTNDDTIDFYCGGTMNSDVTGTLIAMHVFYKMAGEINDEDFAGTD